MGKETCEFCGCRSELGTIEKHYIVPTKVTEQAGMPESAKISLCCNCHFELHTWYRTKVMDMVYDPETKRFRAKSWDEEVKDYESAFNEFRKYKDEQRKTR